MKLKRDAESYLGETVTDAVITVPAYFDRLPPSGHQGGRRDRGFSTCCASSTSPPLRRWAYGLDKGKEDELILVFDLGGGTYDVSLLRGWQGPEDGFSTIQVRATNGDNKLGGDDWDERIVNHLITIVKNTSGIDLANDKMPCSVCVTLPSRPRKSFPPRRAQHQPASTSRCPRTARSTWTSP